MQAVATITSKRQLTIPVNIYKQLGFDKNQKVFVRERNGKLEIESVASVLDRLAGSVKVPKHLRGKPLDEIIEKAKMDYFSRKNYDIH